MIPLPIHHMDDLDVRIFRELGSPNSLQWNVRETYSGIARRIGVDEETVRRRVKRAERLGSVLGWKMVPNPLLIGCECVCVDLDVKADENKEHILQKLKQIEGIIKILNFREVGLQLTAYYPNETVLKEMKEEVWSVCDPKNEPTVWKVSFPSLSYCKSKSIDWMIIREMLEDARKSIDPVSKSIGVSVRTVSRRLTSMIEERAIYLQGTPNFENFSGLSCVFLVFCPELAKKRSADQAVLNKMPRIEIFNTSSEKYSTFVTIFDNLAQADEFMKFVQSLDGVKSVKMGIMKELIVIQDWLRKQLNKQISSS
ncbi:MAG: AsnC family transcriptional regulator [Nitrososphaerota archaeon]|nr:AsnC family transcriptional regulator [Nitrososphaerota archaeon]